MFKPFDIPITYDGMIFGEGLRPDVFVEELIICELKTVDDKIRMVSRGLLYNLCGLVT
ncbi:MAG: GxxExxY protein [Pseudomonadota bacterium]